MKTITLLEKLANNPHYYPHLQDLIDEQPEEIRAAFAKKDGQLLSKYLYDGKPVANFTRVVAE